jgi:glycosyltransferase involved in cell wall biosynthesis
MEKIYNKIGWIAGQGIDGVGGTKHMIEFSKLFKSVKVIDVISDSANYSNRKNFSYEDYEVLRTQDFVNEFEDYDTIYIISFPNNKNTIEEIDKFYSQIKELSEKGKKIVCFMTFNTIAYFNKMPKILYGFNLMDYIFLFSKTHDIANMIRKYIPWKTDIIREYRHPYEYIEKPLKEKENKCIYAGRYARFKGPDEMIDLYKNNVSNTKFEYHGIGRTIEVKAWLDKYDVLNYSKEFKDDKINIFGQLSNKQMHEQFAKSMFAYNGYHLPVKNYGLKSDFSMAEMMENNCICIFNKHYLENVTLNGRKLSTFNAFISYENNPAEVCEKMKYLLNNEEARNIMLENQKYVLKNFYNPEVIIPETVNQIIEKNNKTLNYQDFLEKLIPQWKNIKDVCFEVSDLKLKKPRIYFKQGSRLRKITI